ncbi:uncharacterized protein Z520_04932 [Fonsecaea multimorphosa CBS 102226]|uniref:Uncharacterized protein n=1 Tax=Fonsecaea multimorphosa CBS 102226 TaxID=1442371 RepID=A0A0D2IQV2_9EURO|nr:uncharacterized protein Z520_04932 [Fonsecaea multimorphosa CBS 102226]KIX99356.1 hypothetical protein Z520_04932 [Fonsecaea multimorphosa CBS 102226]
MHSSRSREETLETGDTGEGEGDGLLHPFWYINYVGAGQEVWALLQNRDRKNKKREESSTGGSMMEKARMVRALYDPHRVMERRVKGGLKLGV